MRSGVKAERLSPTEQRVLDCLMLGDQNKLIGQKLGITEATAKVHVKSILHKLGVVNRTQAAIWWYQLKRQVLT